jgi:ribosome-binding factor A
MEKKRIQRLNSLLTEVISEVIRNEVKDPRVNKFVSITAVDITNDLHHAKVSVSVIGTEKEKTQTIEALNTAAGFIAQSSSKKVTMRYFPSLLFKLDTTVEEQMRIDAVLQKIHEEQQSRTSPKKDPEDG